MNKQKHSNRNDASLIWSKCVRRTHWGVGGSCRTTWNPPDWNVHLGWCDDVHVSGLSAHSLASTAARPDGDEPNADGIDIDACQVRSRSHVVHPGSHSNRSMQSHRWVGGLSDMNAAHVSGCWSKTHTSQ